MTEAGGGTTRRRRSRAIRFAGRFGRRAVRWVAIGYAWLDRGGRWLYQFLRYRFPLLGAAWLGCAVLGAVWVLWRATNAYVDPRTPAERSDLIRAVAQVGGGLFLLVGLYFTARTLRHNQETLRLTAEGQVTERFTRAVDQLGATDKDGAKVLEMRIGAIYALERIARDSPKDRATIMEILSAYVRENAKRPLAHPFEEEVDDGITEDPATWPPERPGGPTAPADIQAALTVLGRRARPGRVGGEKIHLDRADLRHADLTYLDFSYDTFNFADLRGATFSDTNLEDALMLSARLDNVNLTGARLRGIWMFGSQLHGANLTGQQLERADFGGIAFHGAIFDEAHLAGTAFVNCNLYKASFLGADLTGANFRDAVLSGARFRGAILKGTDFRGVDLSGARGLTWEQVCESLWDEDTEFPEGLRPVDTTTA